MKRLLTWLLTGVVLAGAAGCRRSVSFQRTNWVRDDSTPTNMMRISCVDANGNPVNGAAVGWGISSCDLPEYDVTNAAKAMHGIPLEVAPNFKGMLHPGGNAPVLTAGDDGVAALSLSNLYLHVLRPDLTNVPDQFVLLDPVRKIGAFAWVFPSNVGCRCTVTLLPLQRVSGQIRDSEGASLVSIKTLLMPSGHVPWSVAEHQSFSSEYQFAVPSGEYELLVCVPQIREAQAFHLSLPPSSDPLRKDLRLRRLK